MKKLILSSIAAIALAASMVGCKTVPSTETLYTTTYAIGVSAALVADQTKISDQDRSVIIDIMNKIDDSVPQTNTTFVVAWTPIAEEHVGKLVTEGKIDADEGKIILTVFSAAVQTVDYVVFKRYPQVGQNIELVEAATHGFCTGFLTFFKPANTFMSTAKDVVYDKEAYDYMLLKVQTK